MAEGGVEEEAPGWEGLKPPLCAKRVPTFLHVRGFMSSEALGVSLCPNPSPRGT